MIEAKELHTFFTHVKYGNVEEVSNFLTSNPAFMEVTGEVIMLYFTIRYLLFSLN
jgi:hypothetical protein